MEHIVQFAIGIDDNGIKERIEKSALADRIFRTKAAKELLGNIEVKEK